MAKLKYLVIHTTDTPFNREVTPDDITLWHLGARKNKNGSYTFMGKNYTAAQLKDKVLKLPSGKTVPVLRTNGRGWATTGYADMIQRSGKLVNLNPYDFNDTIERWELTNGVAGMNSQVRNVVLAGGWSPEGIKNGQVDGDSRKGYMDISSLYTWGQIDTLKKYIRMQLELHPDLIVCGHNNLSSKTCPNFDVDEFVSKYMSSENIRTLKLNKK